LKKGLFILEEKKENAPVSLSLAPCDCIFLTHSEDRLQTSVRSHEGLVDARLTPVRTTSLSNTPLTSKAVSSPAAPCGGAIATFDALAIVSSAERDERGYVRGVA
jgi:hypothetical protein